jgi:transcriptional regulator with XRE-family HTH domain
MENLTVEQLSFAVATLENLVNARGLTQTQLEHLSGVKQSQISKILSRQADPSPEVLIKLFKALGLKLDDILQTIRRTMFDENGNTWVGFELHIERVPGNGSPRFLVSDGIRRRIGVFPSKTCSSRNRQWGSRSLRCIRAAGHWTKDFRYIPGRAGGADADHAGL